MFLSFADLAFGVSAEKGGRIISFRCGDKELLVSDSVHNKYYGATFWLSPQSDYWPQYQCVDELPYKGRDRRTNFSIGEFAGFHKWCVCY